MNEWLIRGGNILFFATVVAACGGAILQTLISFNRPVEFPGHPALPHHLKQGLVIGSLLVLLQAIFLILCYSIDWMKPAAGIGTYFLFCALFVPFLWTAGSIEQTRLDWPRQQPRSRHLLLVIIAGHLTAAISFLLFRQGDAEPGETIQTISRQSENLNALAIYAVWLMINAPWIEELVFRHYLLPRLAISRRYFYAVPLIVTTAIFALGHAGHTDPAWPKILQMTLWGGILGGLRIWLGTPWAIGLHLALNLAAPIIVIFL